jgi:hypothetical protein
MADVPRSPGFFFPEGIGHTLGDLAGQDSYKALKLSAISHANEEVNVIPLNCLHFDFHGETAAVLADRRENQIKFPRVPETSVP